MMPLAFNQIQWQYNDAIYRLLGLQPKSKSCAAATIFCFKLVRVQSLCLHET
jgi:hypothetical protein